MSNNTSKFTAYIVGSTGLCGGAILKNSLESFSNFKNVTTLTRRELPEYLLPKNSEQKEIFNTIVESDSSKWVDKISKDLVSENLNNVFFSALGTTKGAEKGFENQYKIDHDLNLELAKRAKESGYNTYVLVSSSGSNKNSRFPYLKMKGELEDEIIDLKFENLIILRPGPLLGDRHGNKKGFLNDCSSKLGSYLYKTRFQSLLSYPVHGEEVGKTGLQLALQSKIGSKPSVQIIESKEIIELADKF